MEQYRLLAECLLPARMLDWFDLKTWIISKSRHLEDIFDEGKLDKDVVVSKMEITTLHGVIWLCLKKINELLGIKLKGFYETEKI